MNITSGRPPRQGLYDPRHEHDACGVGFVAHIKGRKSHDIVAKGLTILDNLRHRGATGADPLHGDGAGILMQIPRRVLPRRDGAAQGVKLPKAGAYGVGMVFLPRNPAARAACEREIERAIANEGQKLLGWRDVPVDDTLARRDRAAHEPVIRQVFVGAGRGSLDRDAFERKLYIIRKASGHAIRALGLANAQRVLRAVVLAPHHRLQGDAARRAGRRRSTRTSRTSASTSALCLVHQRFSTNTFPTWDLAHPFRFIAHNGEINTLRGNLNWIRVAPGDHPLEAPRRGPRQDLAAHLRRPVGLGLVRQRARAARDGRLSDRPRDDADDPRGVGRQPADGREAPRLLRVPRGADGAVGRAGGGRVHRRQVHRRHARPQRPAARALLHHRRRPHRDVLGDGRARHPAGEDRQEVAPAARARCCWSTSSTGASSPTRSSSATSPRQRPYQDWLDRTQIRLEDIPTPRRGARRRTPTSSSTASRPSATRRRTCKMLMTPMAVAGEEPIGSMGDDTPLAVLSNRAKPLYAYFRQLFAQVTNPPIDPIREQLVMSLVSFIGPRPNLLVAGPDRAGDAPRGVAADPHLRGHGEAAPRVDLHAGPLPSDDPLHVLSGRVGRGGHGARARAALRRCRGRGAQGHQHHHPHRPRGRPRRDPHPGAARHRRRAPPPRARGAAHALRPRGRDRQRARGAPLRAASRGFGAEAIHPNLAFATLLDMRDELAAEGRRRRRSSSATSRRSARACSR